MTKLKYIVIGVVLLVSISLVVACTLANPPVPPQNICMLMRELAPSLVPRS